MSNLINLTILQHADNADVAVSGTTVTVNNSYASGLKDKDVVTLSAMDADTLEAFKKVTDYFTYAFEASCPVIKVAYAARVFSLAGSYDRSGVGTVTPPFITTATPLDVRFEFPGFDVNDFVTAQYIFGTGFDTAALAALAAAGVVVTNGDKAFTLVSNTRECKVYFSQPSGTTGKYVIVYPAAETIIPRT